MENKPTVLVVDDDTCNRLLARDFLEDKYTVYEASSGGSCLDFMNENIPDLVLLDIMMPHLDGDDICYNIKKSAETKKVPIVFMSSMSQEEYETNYGKMLADAFLVKPLSHEILFSTIEMLLIKRL